MSETELDYVVMAKVLLAAGFPDFASANALIAIAEELRNLNVDKSRVVNEYTPEQRARIRDVLQGEFRPHVYPFGGQP